jgi:hypothetical protein
MRVIALSQHPPPETPRARSGRRDQSSRHRSGARAAEAGSRPTDRNASPGWDQLVALARLLGRHAAREHLRFQGDRHGHPTKPPRPAPDANGPSRLFSVQQAADHASLPTEMIRDAIIGGKLKRYNLDGRIRIDEHDLDAYIKSSS